MYRLAAPAKINLFLQIIGDRLESHGFHELVMVMQAITLADHIELTPRLDDGIYIDCAHPLVPCDPSNLAYRAAKLLQKQAGDRGGVDIYIEKRIPVGAGLAGGSTNAAAVLVGLDLLWDLGLTQEELQALAAQLGSDVPFCLRGGTALALGRGDELTPLVNLEGMSVVLAKYRALSVSTPWAYQTYRQQFQTTYAQTAAEQEQQRLQGGSPELLRTIAQRDLQNLSQHLKNDLEKVVLPAYPNVQHLRQAFADFGAVGTMMSGSGPTVFALVETHDKAAELCQHMADKFQDPDLELWPCEFCSQGIHLISSS